MSAENDYLRRLEARNLRELTAVEGELRTTQSQLAKVTAINKKFLHASMFALDMLERHGEGDSPEAEQLKVAIEAATK